MPIVYTTDGDVFAFYSSTCAMLSTARWPLLWRVLKNTTAVIITLAQPLVNIGENAGYALPAIEMRPKVGWCTSTNIFERPAQIWP